MSKSRHLLEIHIATVFFGLSGLFGKWLISLSPFLIVLGRVFFATIALAALTCFSKQSLKPTKSSHYPWFIFLGLILAVHWAAFFRSIQVSTVAIGLLSYSSFPVFTAILEPFVFKEKMIRLNLFYAFLCVLGVFLIIPQFNWTNTTYQGVIWGLFAGFTFSILTVLNRKLSLKYPSSVIAIYQDFFAMIFLLPSLFLLRMTWTPENILLLAVLGIICTAGAHTLFIKGMRTIKAQTASLIGSLEPVYGIILAFFFFQEIPSARTLAGGVLILWTAFLVTFQRMADK